MNVSIASLDGENLEDALVLMKAFYDELKLSFSPFDARRAINELLTTPELGQFLLIVADGGLIGYAVMTFGFNMQAGGREALIDEIYVKPSHRHHGIGTRAMKYLESRARSLGLRSVYLEVASDDRKAQRFYRKLGFDVRHQFCLAERRLEQ